MAGADNGSNQQGHDLAAVQQAADDFCAPGDPFAPDYQMIQAQILGNPISQIR